MNFTVPRAMPLSTLASTLRMDPQALMTANNITNPNAMLMPGTQLMFPDTFGNGLFGNSLFQTLMQAFLQGIGAMPPMGGAQPQSSSAPALGSPAPQPMRQSQPSGWSHPINAIRDRYKQFRGQPLDGDARSGSEDGLKSTSTDAPFQQGNPALEASNDGNGNVRVNTPHVTQWNSIACKDASDLVARRTGGQPRGPDQRIQVAASRPNSSAHVNVNPAGAKAGLDRINNELDKGHAVVVGLAHEDGGGHNRQTGGMTDHFVAITGRGTDEQGRRYYTFHDPATRDGADTNPHCRFYVDPNTGGLFRPAARDTFNKWLGQRYEVTEVR